MLVRIDTALVYNDNSDNIQFDFTENQFFLCYYKLHLPKTDFACSTWTSFKDPPFNFELESIKSFRFFYFIGY